MSDEVVENKEVVEETVEETTDHIEEEIVENQNAVEERVEEEAKEQEEKEGIVAKIREKFFPKKEEVEEETFEIPDDFQKAAEEANFTSAQIEQLAKDYTPEELKQMIPHLSSVEEEEEEEEVVAEEKEETKLDIPEELKPHLERLEKFYEDKYRESFKAVEELTSRLADQEADKEIQELVNQQEKADELFDSISKEFPVFGSTKELARYPSGHAHEGEVIPVGEAFKARNQVWQKAMLFQDAGLDWEESMDEAFAWYKGKYGEKDVRNKVVKDLKKQEKRLSPKRTSKDTAKLNVSEHDYKMQALQEARRKAGIS